MTGLPVTGRTLVRSGIFAAAFALTGAGLVGAAPTADPASASETGEDAAFEGAFRAFELPEDAPVLTPSEELAAAERFAAAPEEEADTLLGTGTASYYGARFAGRRTASGEVFDPGALTAAHRTLPFGSKVRVTSRRNGKSVVVRINDRGPFQGNRVIDLSKAAAQEIGLVQAGHGQVELALLD